MIFQNFALQKSPISTLSLGPSRNTLSQRAAAATARAKLVNQRALEAFPDAGKCLGANYQ